MTTIILDVETKRSSRDCLNCGKEESEHGYSHEGHASCGPYGRGASYTPIGWNNRPALGLSIGCYWDSRDQRIYFFDEANLEETMQRWVEEQPLIVTFNGLQFDLPLLRGILRRRAQERVGMYLATTALCDEFKPLCAKSYDILAEIWKADPASKRVKGLNGLGALAAANGYGDKTGDGAQAPRDWAAGRIAQTCNYCANDVYLTKSLFEQIQRGEPLMRSNGTALVMPKAGGMC